MVLNIWRCDAEDGALLQSEAHTTPWKVTFGIWVVTHSSAGERLGYMLLWKCTSCMIILYSRLNGVRPVLYLVNMSHLICVCVCLSCVSPVCVRHSWDTQIGENTGWPTEYERHIVCLRLILSHKNERYECVCASVSIMTPHTPQASVSDEPWSQGTLHVSLCRVRRQQISDDREAQRKKVLKTLSRSFPGGDSYSYTGISNQRLIKYGMSAAVFWMATSTICTGLNHKPTGMGLLWEWAYWG